MEDRIWEKEKFWDWNERMMGWWMTKVVTVRWSWKYGESGGDRPRRGWWSEWGSWHGFYRLIQTLHAHLPRTTLPNSWEFVSYWQRKRKPFSVVVSWWKAKPKAKYVIHSKQIYAQTNYIQLVHSTTFLITDDVTPQLTSRNADNPWPSYNSNQTNCSSNHNILLSKIVCAV